VIDLTNNAKPEIVLTISAQAIALLKQSASETQEPEQNSSRPRTLILSDSGKVIYTDFQQNNGQLLTAIAQIAEGESPALLVENAHNYSLKRWSEKNQRFE
jgi:CDP-diacylglycerol pyrophosphatase